MYERIASLEAHLQNHARRLEHIEDLHAKSDAKLDAMLNKLTRYEGKLGGALMVLSAVWVFFKFLWEDIIRLLGVELK